MFQIWGSQTAELRRDRLVVIAAIASLVVLTWAYLLLLAGDMSRMMIPLDRPWQAGEFTFQFGMWAVMMTAMMLPSASPMILSFTGIQRSRRACQQPVVATWVFVAGYLVTWVAFAAAATLAQWSLHSLALLSPMMKSTSALVGGGLLLAAAGYQLTPLKQACLATCRTPMSFLLTEWRGGVRGAFAMGVRHGGYCVGCCWALMALLFVTGVMSIGWVAVLAAFVLVEKAAPVGKTASHLSVPVLFVLSAFAFAGSL